MSHESTSLKKSSGDCLKLAKQWYNIWVKWCYFWTTAFFSGSAEALVRCGGKLLIAYFLGIMCAKHYENLTMLSRVTAKNVGDVFFETHCSYSKVCKYCKFSTASAYVLKY